MHPLRSRSARTLCAVLLSAGAWGGVGAEVVADRDRAMDHDEGASCRAAHRTPADPTCPRWLRREADALTLFQPLRFDLGKDTLRPEARAVLDEVVAWLGRHGDARLEIQGHYHDTEYAATPLSKRRAHTVMRYLIHRGVAADRLTAVGYGEAKPRYPAGDRRNWRIELVLMPPR